MRIRPFEADDAAAVASLWQYWFRGKSRVPDPGLTELVTRIYLEDPNVDDEITSLVAEDADGAVLGFLGTSVMPVIVDGEERKLAGIFPSVVAPEASTTVASLLLRKFLAGPQALTFSDGGHAKFERIWETLGGGVGPIQSLRWVKLFRPNQLGLEMLARRRGSVKIARPVLKPLASGADWLGRRALPTQLTSEVRVDANSEKRVATSRDVYRSEELTPALLAELAPLFHAKARLQPQYDEAHSAWQFAEMRKITEQGTLRTRLVRTLEGSPVGWFVYYLRPGGLSSVYAIEGLERHLPGVIDQLFLEADAGGAGALTGRLEPALRRSMRERGALVHNGGSLQLIHSRDKRLRDDALLGRVGFNRLQGENWYWWAIASATVP